MSVEPALPLIPAALEIAAQHQRSVYDALFVALARELSLPGITADQRLFGEVNPDFPEILLLRDWNPELPEDGESEA